MSARKYSRIEVITALDNHYWVREEGEHVAVGKRTDVTLGTVNEEGVVEIDYGLHAVSVFPDLLELRAFCSTQGLPVSDKNLGTRRDYLSSQISLAQTIVGKMDGILKEQEEARQGQRTLA